MARVRGRADVSRYFATVGSNLRNRLLRGAARAAADVIADEARLRCISAYVRQSIKVASSTRDDRIIARVQTTGRGKIAALWLEHGTAPHLISVDESQRTGMSVRRINRIDSEGRKGGKIGAHESLVINGKFVGDTVFHPGAQPYPFLRPALDAKEAEAIGAAQAYITARVGTLATAGTSED